MRRKLVRRKELCQDCSIRKGVRLSMDKMLRAAIFIARIREAQPNKHVLRLRYAKRLLDIVNSFIAEEVHTANSLPKTDPNHMSWNDVSQVLELSRSAAYARYGGKSANRSDNGATH